MWARTRFDIGWRDLGAGALACLRPLDRDASQRALEGVWSPAGGALACTSVRSAYDLLLRALALPPGSEVLYSAINISGMIKAAARHELVAVPVDLDIEHAAPRLDALERARSDRARVLVVAHLFGSRIDLEPILAFAREHGLLVVEDCAQALDDPGDTGHAGADVSLFSFGPLKTATALGGALAHVRDPALLARMRTLQAAYPVQTRRAYLWRILKFAALKALSHPTPYGLLSAGARRLGLDLDGQVTDSVRSIARQKGPKSLRLRPSAPMLSLVARRLRRFDRRALRARARSAVQLVEAAHGIAASPGGRNERHVWWACTLLVKDPIALVEAMRHEGFDAALSESLRVVPAPQGRESLEAVRARQILEQLVFLPCYPGMPSAALAREAAALRRALTEPAG